MTASSVIFPRCPECEKCFQDKADDKDAAHHHRLPTSCHHCFYTICCACVKTKHQRLGDGRSCINCPKCGNSKGFRVEKQTIAIHEFSYQLLQLAKNLQGQLQQALQQQQQQHKHQPFLTQAPPETSNHKSPSSPYRKFSRKTLLSKPSPPKKHNGDLQAKQQKDKAIAASVLKGETYPPGTVVCQTKNGVRGKIQSWTMQPYFSIQYGDGDPEWVEYHDMKALVEAARVAKKGQGPPLPPPCSAAALEDAIAENHLTVDYGQSYVGQDVFKEFVNMGWYWGKVMACRSERQYTVVFPNNNNPVKQKVRQEEIQQWIENAQHQQEDQTKESSAKEQSEEKAPMATDPRSTNNQMTEAGNKRSHAHVTWIDETPVTQTKRPRLEHKPSDSVKIGETLSLPIQVKGTSWKGFDQFISDSVLPNKFREILELMDFLFPVAKGQESFLTCLWENSTKRQGWRAGDEVREKLRYLQKQHAANLLWHQRGSPYKPATKKDLASFIEVLMDLDIAPKLENIQDKQHPSNRRARLQTESNEAHRKVQGKIPLLELCSPLTKKGSGKKTSLDTTIEKRSNMLRINDNLSLPEKARGTGWEGFDNHILDSSLPQKLREILILLDFLFPLAKGEELFVARLYDNSKKNNSKAGSELRAALRDLLKQGQAVEGLQWHKHAAPYVPTTKEDLAAFMKLLMELPMAPKRNIVARPSNGLHSTPAKQSSNVSPRNNQTELSHQPSRSPQAARQKEKSKMVPIPSVQRSMSPRRNKKAPFKFVVTIENYLSLPNTAKGTGWKGFEEHVTDRKRPTYFDSVVKLMDFLFPVASGERSFQACLLQGEKTIHPEARTGLKALEAQNPNIEGLKWHIPGAQYVPHTKRDLAAFIKLLMGLDMSPKLERMECDKSPTLSQQQHPREIQSADCHPPPASTGPTSTTQSSKQIMTSASKVSQFGHAKTQFRRVKLGGAFLIPVVAGGTGWEGFEKYVSEDNFPKTLSAILKMMDFLFPVKPGAEAFVDRLWVKARNKGQSAGALLRLALKNAHRQRPELVGLQWLGEPNAFAPKGKDELRELVKILNNLYVGANFNWAK